MSQFCDGCVYSQTGVYGAATLGQSRALATAAAATFIYRLGKTAGQAILLTGADYSGAELEQRIGALTVVEQDEVLPRAIQVAECWARLPRATLAAWKKQAAATLQEKIGRLPAAAGWGEKAQTPDLLTATPAPIPPQSKVVTATAHPEGIVVVKMEDRQARNMFSEAVLEGLREVFAHIDETPTYKVVILTGYDSYFASGGTKESLLAI